MKPRPVLPHLGVDSISSSRPPTGSLSSAPLCLSSTSTVAGVSMSWLAVQAGWFQQQQQGLSSAWGVLMAGRLSGHSQAPLLTGLQSLGYAAILLLSWVARPRFSSFWSPHIPPSLPSLLCRGQDPTRLHASGSSLAFPDPCPVSQFATFPPPYSKRVI